MLSTIIGMIILSAVTVSMLVAISIGNRALKSSSDYPLTRREKHLIKSAGYSDNEIDIIQIDINNLNNKVRNNEE